MVNRITVRDVTVSVTGRIDFRVHKSGAWQDLWFEVPAGCRPHPDLIACAVASIFHQGCDEFEYLDAITDVTRSRLESATGAIWNAPRLDRRLPSGGKNAILSFSGGLDSLAALGVMGEDVKLVSVDFGGAFERERRFFETFDTNTVRTNVRGHETSWTFMGLGAILLREYLEADVLAFGSILEATPWNFLKAAPINAQHAIFSAAGFTGISPISGITEFGTAKIAVQRFPDLLEASLESLADVKSEKWLRKWSMLKAAAARENLHVSLPERPESSRGRVSFGTSFAIDFLAPGMQKSLPSDEFAEWMDAPVGLADYVTPRLLSFYYKENTNHIRVRNDWERRIAAAKLELGLQPYGGDDWAEFNDWFKILRLFHRVPPGQY